MNSKDIYTLLNLGKDASEETVKKAYRLFARRNHPDLFPDDPARESRFKDVTSAYQSWKLITAAVGQIKRLRKTEAAGAGNGFQPWSAGYTASRAYAKFRPWRVDVWA